MVCSLLNPALLLGVVVFASASAAGQVDDAEHLVQRAVAVLEKPKFKPKAKQSEEDRKTEPETRKHLHEQVAAFLKKVPGLPPLMASTAKNFVVPQIMEFRRLADNATRKLLDGFVALDMGQRHLREPGVLAETLRQLAELYEKVGNSYLASALRNESILLPPFLAVTPKLLVVHARTSAKILSELQRLLETFVKEIEPIVQDSGAKIKAVVNQTLVDIEPRVKKVTEQATQAINETLQKANTDLQSESPSGA